MTEREQIYAEAREALELEHLRGELDRARADLAALTERFEIALAAVELAVHSARCSLRGCAALEAN